MDQNSMKFHLPRPKKSSAGSFFFVKDLLGDWWVICRDKEGRIVSYENKGKICPNSYDEDLIFTLHLN